MNKKGVAVFLGIISFVISLFIFVLSLPILNPLIESTVGQVGGVEGFLIRLIPFVILLFLIYFLLRSVRGERQ